MAEINETFYIPDYKTTSGLLGPQYFRKFTTDISIMNYLLAAQMIHHKKAAGFIIDAVQVGVTFTRFQRQIIPKTQSQLEEWLEELHDVLDDMETCAHYKKWSHRWTSCDMYGGCEFVDVCNKAPEVRKEYLAGEFRRQPVWNPLEEH